MRYSFISKKEQQKDRLLLWRALACRREKKRLDILLQNLSVTAQAQAKKAVPMLELN